MKTIKIKNGENIPDNYTGIAEWSNGTKHWFLDGKLHRKDGPAVDFSDGSKSWYLNGDRHRENGPAIEWSGGTKFWYLDGELHSEDKYKTEMAIRSSTLGKLLLTNRIKLEV